MTLVMAAERRPNSRLPEPNALHLHCPRLAVLAADVDLACRQELADHAGVGEEVLGDRVGGDAGAAGSR